MTQHYLYFSLVEFPKQDAPAFFKVLGGAVTLHFTEMSHTFIISRYAIPNQQLDS